EQPGLVKDASVVIAGNGIDCGKRADLCVARTDATGKYAFKEVPAGPYAVAFHAPAGAAKFQDETRQFTVSPNAVETVSVVLLAEGMTVPEPPAELTSRPANQQAGYGSGLTSNPFFWYWMFNQPWIGGYSRPPVVMMSPDRTVTVDRSQPTTSATGRQYSSYGPGGKPAPVKGVSRPGQTALGSGSAPDTSVRSGSGSAGSVRAPANTAPPRVGAGGGGTASRSAPPRVRVGRR
ncbi:MAG TPA: carboxypeptidase-like regulatory domain-containing protein, partial [Chloroflexota bacterium]|nr:carboxypeptidase-like regulatory domain-containing protein [Chloroflexota bacterium]